MRRLCRLPYAFFFNFIVLFLACIPISHAQQASITYLTHFGGTSPELAVYQRLAEAFMAVHPQIDVQVRYPSGNYLEFLKVMIAGGTPPDVTFLANWDIPPLAEEGLLLPLDSFVARDGYDLDAFFPLTVEVARYRLRSGQVHLYGIPRHPSPIAMYYNASAYERAGLAPPPSGEPADAWTWEAYLENAKRLTVDTNQDGVPDQFGTQVPRTIPHTLFPVIRSFGGGILDDKTRRTAFNEYTAEALQFLVDLASVHQVAPRFGAAVPSFADGGYAMEVNIFPQMGVIHAGVGDSFEWNVAPMPAGRAGRVNRSVAGTHVILSASRQPEAAWQFLKFLGSDRAQEIIFEAGVVMPARISTARRVFENPPEYMKDKNINVFVEGLLAGGQAEAILPEWTDIVRIFTEELNPVWREQSPVTTALSRIATRVDALLQ